MQRSSAAHLADFTTHCAGVDQRWVTAFAEEREHGAVEGEDLGDFEGPPRPGPSDEGGDEEGDLVGPVAPPPAKKRKACLSNDFTAHHYHHD